jgi:signal peptidase I
MARNRILKFWLDTFDLLVFLILVFWIILFIRLFIGTPYTVVWVSMMPTFESNDWIIVEKITQRFWNFERWDVVVFVPQWKDIPYIKRIIWLPWETVKFVDNKTYICNNTTPDSEIKSEDWKNCFKLNESYTYPEAETIPQWDKTEFEVTNWYFVMWDNRWHTSDSLSCFSRQCYQWANYLVSDQYMIGRVMVRLFPKFTTF